MPKIVRRGGLIACMSAALCALFAGCNDECSKGKSECVSDSLIRTCVAGDDGNTWLVHECGANEVCAKNANALSGDAGGDESTTAGDSGVAAKSAALSSTSSESNVPACVGTCVTGEHECVNNALAKLCVSGGVWQLDACDVGEACTNGVCQISSGADAVQMCKPNLKACASEKVEKVCNPDGTAWTEQPCAMNETCVKDECVPDPDSSCDDMNACIDSKTAARCLAGGKGFEVVKCPATTWCEGGLCQGKVCAIGKTCNGPNQVRECVDGESVKDTQCGANEVCQQLKDTAECVPVNCTVGQTQCGDPRDPKADATKTFTTCVVSGAGSGVPEWVTGSCEGDLSCNPALTGTGTPCAQDCTPGTIRCAPVLPTGANDATQECGKDGKWGAAKSCNPGTDTQLVCTPILPLAGDLAKAVCADPVCKFALLNPATATGTCDGEKIRTCLRDGTLDKDATACAAGACQNVPGGPVGSDARKPGICVDPGVCVDGEQQCVKEGVSVGQLYQTCVNNTWSTKLTSCDKDAMCFDSVDAKGLMKVACGGECIPGARQCDPTDLKSQKLQTCSKDGKWGKSVKCDLGFCSAAGTDATCAIACVPGTFSCSGATVYASDGKHTGLSQASKCGSDGTFAAAADCASGTTCMTSAAGTALGCVQCIGEDVVGGNAQGRVDTRCDPAAPADKLQTCTADNKWGTSHTCAGDTTCGGPAGSTCSGTCANPSNPGGAFMACTETFVKQICGSCNVATSGGPVAITNCTEANIAATVNATTTTCTGQGFGTPGAWAGFTDCCGMQQGNGAATCATTIGYGTKVATGDKADCCSAYVSPSPSPLTFAACFEP